MVRAFAVVALTTVWGFMGCSGDSPPPGSSPAEVPAPGPAVLDDPGPAPDGQSEPPLEGPDDAANSETSSSGPTLPPPPDPTDGDDTASDPPGNEDVSLKLQSWDATEKLISSHKGRVVVVDFWSTSCLPCRREFPHLVKLQRQHPERVACVSVSLDYSGRKSRPPETYREPVLEYLTEQQATIDNILSTDDPDELSDRLELPPIPLVWVFNPAGERVRTFDNGDLEGKEFTYTGDVIPFVESLLANH